MQRMLIQLHLSANQRAEPFVDHAGVLRDSKTGRPINGHRGGADGAGAYDDEDTMRELLFCCVFRHLRAAWLMLVRFGAAGYSFFDSGEIELLGRKKSRPSYYNTGKIIPMAEY